MGMNAMEIIGATLYTSLLLYIVWFGWVWVLCWFGATVIKSLSYSYFNETCASTSYSPSIIHIHMRLTQKKKKKEMFVIKHNLLSLIEVIQMKIN